MRKRLARMFLSFQLLSIYTTKCQNEYEYNCCLVLAPAQVYGNVKLQLSLLSSRYHIKHCRTRIKILLMFHHKILMETKRVHHEKICSS